MFDNLKWDIVINLLAFNGDKVGDIEITPGVIFSVRKHLNEHWEKGYYILDGYHYSVGLEAYGCSTSVNFNTRGEVEAYLTEQQNKASMYETIKAKRDAICNRINPLREKLDKTSELLFSLLKN